MPINISNDLPAFSILQSENIFVMSHDRAEHQDIRPLKLVLLNLMPTKIDTETQFMRLLSNTPLQVDIELLQMMSHVSRNTPTDHLINFYKSFEDIKNNYYDGLIITGAPIEQLDFEDVDYWQELCEIMDWSRSHVFSTLHVCWGAQAGLFHHYNVPKYPIEEKMFGIFPHRTITANHPMVKGFDEIFMVPHSRHTEVRKEDIEAVSKLKILTFSDISGVHIVADETDRQFFITGHSEYDRETLGNEFFRDIKRGMKIDVPYNYFPDDDPEKIPPFTWRCHASLMFSNWLNFCVYQQTPFNLEDIEEIKLD